MSIPKHEHILHNAEALLNTLRAYNKPLTIDRIASYLKLKPFHKKALRDALHNLRDEGRLIFTKHKTWVVANEGRTLVGKYEVHSATAAFVHVTAHKHAGKYKEAQRIFIHPNFAGDAWHGDIVRVILLPKQGRRQHDHKNNTEAQGRIAEILECAPKELMARGLGDPTFKDICAPADSRFRITIHTDKHLERHELARVRLLRKRGEGIWEATVLETFGCEDSVQVQENLVKLNHEAPGDFPPSVLHEADAFPTQPQASDMDGRKDVRHLPFVTIDGPDARDFDDAVYAEPYDKGWRLYVGIADVTHYVHPRSALDKEAHTRGNSWYFPRSVQPMLPEALSHGLCSLRPHEDKLIMLAELHIDASGHVQYAHFSPAILRSAARLTYDEVRDTIVTKEATALDAFSKKHDTAQILLDMLQHLHDLAHVLRRQRIERGALDFVLPEAEYVFDSQDRIADIRKKQHHFAHQMIEECMLAANEAVARFLEEKDIPFLYRVHPEPDPLRIRGLFETLSTTSLASHIPARAKATDLQSILRAAHNANEDADGDSFLLNRLALRTMTQARYSPENVGHFGLASACYCHFTSPIRRYADMVVHRALKYALGIGAGRIPTEARLLQWGDHLHHRERAALEAEREMARRLATLLLQGREGEGFEAIISAVTDFGFFVEFAAMPVEGLVPIRFLGDDLFEYDPRRQELLGLIHADRFTLGQKVRVRLIEANLGRLEITLGLVGKGGRVQRANKEKVREKKPKAPIRKGHFQKNTKRKQQR